MSAVRRILLDTPLLHASSIDSEGASASKNLAFALIALIALIAFFADKSEASTSQRP
jgi:hypothetical protein